MSTEPVGVGFCGCGGMARGLAKAVAASSWGRLLGAYDPIRDNARRLCDEAPAPDAQVARSYRAMLDRDDVGAVVVATPNHLHPRHTIEALRAGKHVFSEKPMALRARDCRRVLETARAVDRQVMVGQVVRFMVVPRRVHDLVVSGEIGRPLVMHTVRASAPGRPDPSVWRADPKKVGGLLFEVSAHELDYMCWIMGTPRRVYARITPSRLFPGSPYEEISLLTIEFDDNRTGTLEMSQLSAPSVYDIRVGGERGSVHALNAWSAEAGIDVGCYGQDLRHLGPDELGTTDQIRGEIDGFLQAVVQGTPVPVPGVEAARAIAVAEAAYRSARLGRVQVVHCPE